MTTLAASDGVAIWLAAATLLMQIALTVFVLWREQRSKEVARRLDKIDQLEEQITTAAEKRVDQKIDAAFAQLGQRIEELNRELSRITRRLERGDGSFDELHAKNAKLLERVLTELASMKDWMNDRFATQDQIAQLRGEVGELRKQVHR